MFRKSYVDLTRHGKAKRLKMVSRNNTVIANKQSLLEECPSETTKAQLENLPILKDFFKIIKEFSTYEAARNKRTEAEHTSNIDSDEIRRPRRRKIHFPGETSSSEDELFINKKKDRPRSPETSTSALPLSLVPPCLDDSLGGESVSLLSPISIQQPDISNQGSVSEIQRIKGNQATMWSAITELTNIARKNSLKLDEIVTKIDKLTSSNRELESSTDMELISSLPVGMEDFENLNQKVIESASVRKNLVRIFL